MQNFLLDTLVSNKDLVLYLLMFSVGMSIGLHKGIIKKIKEYHVKILIIPAGIIVGTLLGGVLLSMITKYNIGESTSVVSGLGWYSLAGVTIGNLAGAQLGSIAFLSNLMREDVYKRQAFRRKDLSMGGSSLHWRIYSEIRRDFRRSRV